MPKMNGTGPRGQGPMTGRGFGTCGSGCKRGFGLGQKRFFSPKNELKALEEEREILEEELLALKEEIQTLKSDSE